MSEMTLAELPDEFDKLAVRAMLEEDVEVELAALMARVREASEADAGWQQHLKEVRDQLMKRLRMLSVPQAGLPITLGDPRIQSERAFYADAIVHLDAVMRTA